MRRTLRRLARGCVYAIITCFALAGLFFGSLETSWGKNQLRRLLVRQANQYLTATLEIAELRGSLFRDLELNGIRLSRDGQAIVTVDQASLGYSIRELIEDGTLVRRLRLIGPQIVAERQADGRWNLAALLKPRASEDNRAAPRPIEIQSLEVVNGLVILKDPLTFGAVRAPGRFERLQLSLAFKRAPDSWRVAIAKGSWLGGPSDLAMDSLAGAIAGTPGTLSFDQLRVRSAQSAFAVDGRVARGGRPATPVTLDLHVAAERFVFQEWARTLPALARFPIDSRFDAQLRGPLATLAVDLDFHSNAGDARGPLVLDTTIPGWHAAGTLNLTHLNLAPWFNNAARRADISGRATFDLALELGHGVPRGTYAFNGSHAAFMGYSADRVRVRGRITSREWLIDEGTALAYRSKVSLSAGTIAIQHPYAFQFQGTAREVDLRAIPVTIPVPHVESMLAFDYDVAGEFARPGISGQATFEESQFIGAHIGAGTTGAVSTPLEYYKGEGDLSGIDINRWGRELNVAWMQEHRYAGSLAGHFRTEVFGVDAATMTLYGGGHVTRADLFGGSLTDGEVEVTIASGSVEGTYNGHFAGIDPAVAFDDDRYAASLSGAGLLTVKARDLMRRPTSLDDYNVVGTLTLERSEARGVQVDSASLEAGFVGGRMLSFPRISVKGPQVEMSGRGVFALDHGPEHTDFEYDVTRADLALFKDSLGEVSGEIATTGEIRGPRAALHAVGDATVSRFNAFRVSALSTTGKYDITFPLDDPTAGVFSVDARASFLEAFGQMVTEAVGTVAYEKHAVTTDLKLTRGDGLAGTIAGNAVVHTGERALDIASLNLSIGGVAWRMPSAERAPVLSWDDTGTTLSPLTLVEAGNGQQRIDLSGTWRPDGGGEFHVNAAHVFLDTLTGTPDRAAAYGGLVNLNATLTGTTEHPVVSGQISVTEGRVRRLTYERLAGQVDYADGALQIDLRLDQAPGVWLTAKGSVPPAFFDANRPEAPIDVVLVSSDVSLGLLEGITTGVREVTGQMRANLHVTGTRRLPTFAGTVDIAGAGFQVTASGARYKNGIVALHMVPDRINVSAFHLEDRNGHPLEVRGSLGTAELQVGDLEVDIRARRFEVLRNATGNVEIDANLKLRGLFQAPRLLGDVAIAGGELKIDELLARTLFQPYSTHAIASTPNVISALNPWDRLSLDIAVHSPGTLRITGENLRVSEHAPLGVGSFNLRAIGDLFAYKAPAQALSITGSLDSVSGSYSFQGRRFELDPSSSIDFRGDLNPGVFISVNRVISGVETRVTISGTLGEPELALSSTPPLDPSEILSLIVFNTSTNELSAVQQRELAIRAGTLAVGFLTSSLTAALERSIGLDILEIEPVTGVAGGAKVTIGDEIAPGLMARFSRQFGVDQYDQATIEYHISRILRLRATLSDARTQQITRSPFLRLERAGIDLLLFFSF